MTNLTLSSFIVIGVASAVFGFFALLDGFKGCALAFLTLTLCCIFIVRTFQ